MRSTRNNGGDPIRSLLFSVYPEDQDPGAESYDIDPWVEYNEIIRNAKLQDLGDMMRSGIMRVESADGELMMNPTSSATGLYGQLYNEIKDLPFMKGISREQFRDDRDLQNRVLQMRMEGEVPGIPGLYRNARELEAEYRPQFQEKGVMYRFRPDEIVALTNYLGRQGTREYLASLRDGTTYTPPGDVNKSPQDYLDSYNEGVLDYMDRQKQEQPSRTVDTGFSTVKNADGGRVVKYNNGGKGPGDPPNYSLGQQVLDYLESYGKPGGSGNPENRFDPALEQLAEFFLSRQGQELGEDPRRKYSFEERDFVQIPSEAEMFPEVLDRVLVTSDPREASRYSPDQGHFDRAGGKRSFVGYVDYDPVAGRHLTASEVQDLKDNNEDEILDRLVGAPMVYNYPSSNPSNRANIEEFYHAVQKVAEKAQGIVGAGFEGSSEDVRELVDMGQYGPTAGLLMGEYNPIDDLVNLYQATQPERFGNEAFYEGVSPSNKGEAARYNMGRYYFGKGNKTEADAALNSGILESRRMGILPDSEITAQDLPEILKRFEGYTATQSGGTEFHPEKLEGWKPDGKKIAKIGKNGEVTLTKYGQKWMQDDENKLRFKERTMTEGEDKKARLDTRYTRILEGLIYDAVNERGLFDPEKGSLENIRESYDRNKEYYDEDDFEYSDIDKPYNQPGSGKTPIELLLSIINTGGGLGARYGERSARSEEYLRSRSE